MRLERIKQKQIEKEENLKRKMKHFDFKGNNGFLRNFKNVENKGHDTDNDPYKQY